MPSLNLPFLDQLANSRSILIAGIGGGFDVFCGLPLYFHLRERGHQVHLANYSFSEIQTYPSGVRLSDTLVGVTADHPHMVVYCPELHLARWFRSARGEEVPVWAFHKTGVRPLRANYERLAAHLQIDTVILVDGGVDSLARGTEAEPGTFIEDSVSMAALRGLPGVATQILACVGFGAEREITHAHILENMADLARRGAFLGACALTRDLPEYRAYEDAVMAVHAEPFQDPSVINASIVSAVRGEYGDYHLTAKTHGRRLWISPLMALYWCFDFPAVAAQHPVLPDLDDTFTFQEAVRAAMVARRALDVRRARSLPL